MATITAKPPTRPLDARSRRIRRLRGPGPSKGCTAGNLKKVTSGEIAGGFVGETSRAYLVDTQVNSVLVELLLQVVNALVKLLYLDKVEQVGVIDLGKWFPAIFGKVFDLKVLSEGNVLYVNLFG